VDQVTRRDAVKALAAGAAVAVGAGAAKARDGAAPRVRGSAPAGTGEVERHTQDAPRLARVERCRSWERRVYLTIEDGRRGWTPISASGLAIAAACQAADRPVAVLVWGHEAEWSGGEGRFEGALLAIERSDLAGATRA
jgi:hypothetical protein